MQMIFDLEGESVQMRPIPAISKIEMYYRYKFRCDGEDTAHEMMCEDWEIYEPARSWKNTYDTDDAVWEKIYERFFSAFMKERDLHFFVGTHNRWGTWMIIGLYYPPRTGPPNTRQARLFGLTIPL